MAAPPLNLTGRAMPSLQLPSTAGHSIRLSSLGTPLAVLYVYPMTGRPGVPMPDGWDLIPGALGCTAEACSFRDRYADLRALGVDLYGLSSQSCEYQREAADRLRLPFPLLSDETLASVPGGSSASSTRCHPRRTMRTRCWPGYSGDRGMRPLTATSPISSAPPTAAMRS